MYNVHLFSFLVWIRWLTPLPFLHIQCEALASLGIKTRTKLTKGDKICLPAPFKLKNSHVISKPQPLLLWQSTVPKGAVSWTATWSWPQNETTSVSTNMANIAVASARDFELQNGSPETYGRRHAVRFYTVVICLFNLYKSWIAIMAICGFTLGLCEVRHPVYLHVQDNYTVICGL